MLNMLGKFSADDILKCLSCFLLLFFFVCLFVCFFFVVVFFKKIRFEISCRFALNVKLYFLRKIRKIPICCVLNLPREW